MRHEVTDLAVLLEQEIAMGRELLCNVAAQKDAIVDWNPSRLMQELESREAYLRSLEALEQERGDIIKLMGFASGAVTLSRLVSELPVNAPERTRMLGLREQARGIFTLLQTEERNLNGLMETLLSHIQSALSPLARDAAPIYTETGAAGSKRPPSALVHSKA